MSFRNARTSRREAARSDDEDSMRTGLANDPITIDDDDGDEPMTIDDDDDETVTADDDEPVFLGSACNDMRSVTLPPNTPEISSVSLNGCIITPGVTIEIADESHEQLFFFVRKIHLYAGKTYLRGWRIKRCSQLKFFDHRKNEVAIVMMLLEDDEEAELARCSTIIELPAVVVLRKLIFTNVVYPWGKEDGIEDEKSDAWKHDHAQQLVCRWSFTEKCKTLGSPKVSGYCFRRLSEQDCVGLPGYAVSDSITLERWLRRERVELDEHGRPMPYTYGDACGGAGGAAAGAHAAGYRLKWFVDNWSGAIDTARRNLQHHHPDCKFRHMDIVDFCQKKSAFWLFVDLLHVSCPCQGYSPMNTSGDQQSKDEKSSLIFIMPLLLLLSRPRICTFENVPGLLNDSGLDAFEQVIKFFLRFNFSCRVSVDDLRRYGNPSRRVRLMITAACAGQSLPSPLPFTHGPGTGRDFVTIGEALRSWEGVQLPGNMKQLSVPRTRSAPPNLPQPHQSYPWCICTDGAGWHHDGTRYYNGGETAALNGFYPGFILMGGLVQQRKLVGNAVPTVAYHPQAGHFLQHMSATDRLAAARPRVVVDLI